MNPWIHKSKSKSQSDFGRDQVTQENHDFPLERKAPKEDMLCVLSPSAAVRGRRDCQFAADEHTRFPGR